VSTKSDGQVVIEIVADDDKAEQQLENTADALEKLSNAAENTAESLSAVTQDLEKTQEAAQGTKQEIDHVGESAEKSSKDIGAFTEELKNSEEEAKVAAAAAVVAGALIAIGAEAVQASMKFDSAFAKTQTIMDQNAMSAKQMREEILDLSKSSGMSASNVSEAVYQAISGSVLTEDATAFVDQANKLAVSGFTSLSNATDVLTTALNAYGLEADTVGGISNVLIQTQNLGKTSVDELASSMGKAISTGSAYGVNLENLSAAYVELTRGGIDTAEATTYISAMLNELGDSGSNVGGILQELTGQTFGQLMAQGWSLGDVLQVLSDTVDGDAEALMGLWSSQEAGKASNAVMTQGVADFNAVCAQMQQEMAGTTGTTEKAYKTMTNTSEFIDQRFNNSINNLGIAFGDNLSPAVDGAKSLLTGIAEGLTSVVEKYPSISAVVTGLTFGVGAISIALTAYTLKTKLAKDGTLKLTAAMLKNPVTLIITGITAAAVGLATYAAKTADATEETEKLSATSELQKRKIEELNVEYEEVCETMGETSAEAQLLKEKIDAETESFERNKKTAEEAQKAFDETMDAIDRSSDAYNDSIEKLDEEYESTENLIAKLNELTDAENQTAAAKEEILTIVDLINDRMPGLALTYDKLTNILSTSPDEIAKIAAEDYRKEKTKTEYTRLGQIENDVLPAARLARDEAIAKRNAAQSDVDYYNYDLGNWDVNINGTGFTNIKTGEYLTSFDMVQKQNAAKAELEKAQADVDAAITVVSVLDEESNSLQQSLSQGFVEAAAERAGGMEAMTSVTDNLAASMQALSASYTEAYESAYDSITGQYALWDTAADVVAMDAEAVMAALQSQEDYWTSYNANINELIARQGEVEGLDEMISAFGDGSEESVNMIAMMAGMNNDDLVALVAQFEEKVQAEKAAAESLGEAKVGLKQRTQEVIDEAIEGVGQLNLSDEARRSGIDTINGYIEGVGELLPDVQNAYWQIGEAIRAALYGNTFRKPAANGGGRISTYASGTAYANSGLALVGETGPELLYLRGGERILDAEETRSILNSVYPVAPQMATVGVGAPSIAGRSSVQIHATIAVPVQVDGREFARVTAEYMGEEMEFEVM